MNYIDKGRQAPLKPFFVDSPSHMADTEWLFRKNKNDGTRSPSSIATKERARSRKIS